MNLNLPEPIATYFDADRRDAEAVASCFTNDAVVKDEGRTYTGVAAIKAGKTAGKAKYKYTSDPLSVRQQDGRTVVTGRLTGNFPGSPVDLRFAFRLERGRIASLEIAP